MRLKVRGFCLIRAAFLFCFQGLKDFADAISKSLGPPGSDSKGQDSDDTSNRKNRVFVRSDLKFAS